MRTSDPMKEMGECDDIRNAENKAILTSFEEIVSAFEEQRKEKADSASMKDWALDKFLRTSEIEASYEALQVFLTHNKISDAAQKTSFSPAEFLALLNATISYCEYETHVLKSVSSENLDKFMATIERISVPVPPESMELFQFYRNLDSSATSELVAGSSKLFRYECFDDNDYLFEIDAKNVVLKSILKLTDWEKNGAVVFYSREFIKTLSMREKSLFERMRQFSRDQRFAWDVKHCFSIDEMEELENKIEIFKKRREFRFLMKKRLEIEKESAKTFAINMLFDLLATISLNEFSIQGLNDMQWVVIRLFKYQPEKAKKFLISNFSFTALTDFTETLNTLSQKYENVSPIEPQSSHNQNKITKVQRRKRNALNSILKTIQSEKFRYYFLHTTEFLSILSTKEIIFFERLEASTDVVGFKLSIANLFPTKEFESLRDKVVSLSKKQLAVDSETVKNAISTLSAVPSVESDCVDKPVEKSKHTKKVTFAAELEQFHILEEFDGSMNHLTSKKKRTSEPTKHEMKKNVQKLIKKLIRSNENRYSPEICSFESYIYSRFGYKFVKQVLKTFPTPLSEVSSVRSPEADVSATHVSSVVSSQNDKKETSGIMLSKDAETFDKNRVDKLKSIMKLIDSKKAEFQFKGVHEFSKTIHRSSIHWKTQDFLERLGRYSSEMNSFELFMLEGFSLKDLKQIHESISSLRHKQAIKSSMKMIELSSFPDDPLNKSNISVSGSPIKQSNVDEKETDAVEIQVLTDETINQQNSETSNVRAFISAYQLEEKKHVLALIIENIHTDENAVFNNPILFQELSLEEGKLLQLIGTERTDYPMYSETYYCQHFTLNAMKTLYLKISNQPTSSRNSEGEQNIENDLLSVSSVSVTDLASDESACDCKSQHMDSTEIRHEDSEKIELIEDLIDKIRAAMIFTEDPHILREFSIDELSTIEKVNNGYEMDQIKEYMLKTFSMEELDDFDQMMEGLRRKRHRKLIMQLFEHSKSSESKSVYKILAHIILKRLLVFDNYEREQFGENLSVSEKVVISRVEFPYELSLIENYIFASFGVNDLQIFKNKVFNVNIKSQESSETSGKIECTQMEYEKRNLIDDIDKQIQLLIASETSNIFLEVFNENELNIFKRLCFNPTDSEKEKLVLRCTIEELKEVQNKIKNAKVEPIIVSTNDYSPPEEPSLLETLMAKIKFFSECNNVPQQDFHSSERMIMGSLEFLLRSFSSEKLREFGVKIDSIHNERQETINLIPSKPSFPSNIGNEGTKLNSLLTDTTKIVETSTEKLIAIAKSQESFRQKMNAIQASVNSFSLSAKQTLIQPYLSYSDPLLYAPKKKSFNMKTVSCGYINKAMNETPEVEWNSRSFTSNEDLRFHPFNKAWSIQSEKVSQADVHDYISKLCSSSDEEWEKESLASLVAAGYRSNRNSEDILEDSSSLASFLEKERIQHHHKVRRYPSFSNTRDLFNGN